MSYSPSETWQNCQKLASKHIAKMLKQQEDRVKLQAECRTMGAEIEEQIFERITPAKKKRAISLLTQGFRPWKVAQEVQLEARQVYHIAKTLNLTAKRMKCYPPETKAKAREMWKTGTSIMEIAAILNVHDSSVRNWIKQ